MDRLERLVNLVAALLAADRPLPREELRTRVGGYAPDDEAFRRNFERDKELLRQMGMPLVLEPLDPFQPEGMAGYRIPRDRYELPDPGLADDELAALHLAASAVEVEGAWGRSASTSALWKLAGASGGEVPDTAALLSRQATALELPAGESVAVLFGAAAARQQVRFRYRDEVREVDPWRLSYRNGQWYLAGFDHLRGASRTFRLDRIRGVADPVGEPGAFERPVGGIAAPAPAWQLGDEEQVTASLLVDAVQADWAAAQVGDEAITERRPDGSVVLSLAVTNRDGFRSFVLGFLDHVEILGPDHLRHDLIAYLEQLAAVSSASGGAG
ncbi:MAG TPA: WYL domain-containing protein [Acidimicrobiales bacterium]|nr:WYL domain-containing protein [Acidimicrobiales bacterium]